MKINREQFLANLEAVQPGLSSKEVIEQSNSFVFRAGEVITYNDEVSCRHASLLSDDIEGAVAAAPLLAILRKMPEDEVEVEVTDSEFIIHGKRRKAGIRMEAQINLPISVVEEPGDWQPLHEDFAAAVSVVQQCAGRDETNFALTCVHLHPKWVEACDNYQICRWKMKTRISAPTLVRKSSIKHVTTLGMIEFAESPAWLHFRNSVGLRFSCRRFVEEFPELGGLLECQGSKTTLPKGLADAVEKAKVFSEENTDTNMVLVELRAGKLRLRGEGASGWYTETKSVQYDGEPLSFLISPDLLADIVQRHNDCTISANKLKVDGGGYVYVSALSRPDADKDEEK